MDKAPTMARRAIKASSRHEFRTFSVGVSLPEGVQEREDELRADLKLKGNETVKTHLGRAVSTIVADKTRKPVDRGAPEATFLADFGKGRVEVTTRPLFFFGRYAKLPGVPQRRELCKKCSGSGCGRCRRTGYERAPSVESEVRRKLSQFTGSGKMTLTWIGSEDRQSRVYPPGRPFVAEVKNPVKRKIPRTFASRFSGGSLRVHSGTVLPSKPLSLPKFRFSTRIVGTASAKVGTEAASMVAKSFRRTPVRFERPHDQPVEKTVYSAKARARGRFLVVEAELEGGLPVKRFVTGESVSPSVAEVLGTEVVVKRFDITRVTQVGRFGFS